MNDPTSYAFSLSTAVAGIVYLLSQVRKKYPRIDGLWVALVGLVIGCFFAWVLMPAGAIVTVQAVIQQGLGLAFAALGAGTLVDRHADRSAVAAVVASEPAPPVGQTIESVSAKVAGTAGAIVLGLFLLGASSSGCTPGQRAIVRTVLDIAEELCSVQGLTDRQCVDQALGAQRMAAARRPDAGAVEASTSIQANVDAAASVLDAAGK